MGITDKIGGPTQGIDSQYNFYPNDGQMNNMSDASHIYGDYMNNKKRGVQQGYTAPGSRGTGYNT